MQMQARPKQLCLHECPLCLHPKCERTANRPVSLKEFVFLSAIKRLKDIEVKSNQGIIVKIFAQTGR